MLLLKLSKKIRNSILLKKKKLKYIFEVVYKKKKITKIIIYVKQN
jgi:hypothetical protein